MNTWAFVDGDIVLSSDNEEQMVMANQWIVGLTQTIRAQVMEEVNGRNINEPEQLELPEVPC